MAAFQQGLQGLGWSIGRNLRLDHRWGPLDPEHLRQRAQELVALAPDVMIVAGGAAAEAVQRASRTVPVVLTQSIDPVGAGYVASLARPGGNVTGFTQFEYSLSGKWLQLLKELTPSVTSVAVLRDLGVGSAGIGQWAVIQAMSEQIGVEFIPISIRDVNEMERGIAAFARGSNGGLIVSFSPSATIHRQAIIASAARYRLPATVLRHVNAAIRKLFHLRIPSLLMRARAQATVRVWKKRLEHQAHSRSDIRGGCGLPVATRAEP